VFTAYHPPLAKVELTRHLYQFFPQLADKELIVEAQTIADVVREMERIAPGFAFYVCDERGRLRRHVNIFVDELSIGDRAHLSDPVQPTSRVFIMQALSGG
jgi:sulfur-carrier protein